MLYISMVEQTSVRIRPATKECFKQSKDMSGTFVVDDDDDD